MNIEFIKWLVSYAKGFEYKEDNPHLHIAIPTGLQRTLVFWMDFQEWHKIYYPLLLQRAIEGINREHFNQGSTKKPIYIKIAIDKYEVIDSRILNDYNYFYFSAKMNHDQTKEEALKYIWEKME